MLRYVSTQEAVKYLCYGYLGMGFSNVSDYDVRHSQEKNFHYGNIEFTSS